MNAYEIDLTSKYWKVSRYDTLRRVIQISVDDKVVNNVVGALNVGGKVVVWDNNGINYILSAGMVRSFIDLINIEDTLRKRIFY